MQIVITRPEEDAIPLAEKLKALGHSCIICPLIKIEPRQAFEIPKRNFQAICLTSANGIRAIKNILPLQHFPVIAIGPQTMRIAKSMGFQNVKMQGGDVNGLTKYISENLNLENGPLLYLSGSETSGDLEGKLKSAGFDVERTITYDAVAAPLTANIVNSDAVMLYSPRTAKLWRKAIEDLNLNILHIKHICLSASVAANLPQSWNITVASQPTESAILQVLD